MIIKIVQLGHPVLRQQARSLSVEEIRSPSIQQLIEWMRETMHDAPGVGLAAPQIGVPLKIAVIEDRADYLKAIPPEKLAERDRRPVPFQVLINPKIELSGGQAEFHEGCLSFPGYVASVKRALIAKVTCLNHKAEETNFTAEGWHARIVQHETDHLNGTVYVDRMNTRTLSTVDNANKW